MASGIEFSLGRWSAWAPELESRAAWRAWAFETQDIPPSGRALPDVKDLPAGLRRRLSPLGKLALRVAMDVAAEPSLPVVFSSRSGNITQTLGLLKSLAGEEPVSPTGFGMSVHNALAGTLSIITGNREPHTAIAAGRDSLCLGLMEATAMLAEGANAVLLLHCDEPIPKFYAPFGDTTIPFAALALVLLPAGEGEGEYSLGFSGRETTEGAGDPLPGFMRFLAGRRESWQFEGAEGQWRCDRHA